MEKPCSAQFHKNNKLPFKNNENKIKIRSGFLKVCLVKTIISQIRNNNVSFVAE